MNTLLARLSLAEKVALLTGADMWSLPACPGIGLEAIVLSDGPSGVRGRAWDERSPSVLLPCGSALGATWDEAAAERAGRLLGAEARRKGVHVVLGPTVNLHRSPLAGRNFESFAEDRLLAGQLAAAYVRGAQSMGVAACVKHFAGNESETERMTYDARIGERALREWWLAPFEAAVRDGGAWAVMAAYNGVNGASMTENGRLLRDVLKGEWGFDGVVVSDWLAARSNEATALAGLDVVMPGPYGPWGEDLVAAVAAGRVPEAVVDDKVLRLLRLAERVGALGEPAALPSVPAPAPDEVRALAARAMVLLRNEGAALPLEPGPRRVALVGPALALQGGGSAHVNPAHVASLAEGLGRTLGAGTSLVVRPGVFPRRTLAPLSPALIDEPGLGVEWRAADGAVVRAEHRRAAQLVLMPGELPSGAEAVVVTGTVTVATRGRHRFSVVGIGESKLRVGDRELSVDLLPETGDLAGILTRPPEARLEVELEAGQTVPLELRHEVPPGMPFVAVAIGHEPPRGTDDEELEAAVAAARDADAAVVIVSTGDEVECEGMDRSTLALPGRQDELVRRVAAACPRTVVVVNAGAPVLMPWRDEVAAILWAWFPGQEGGDALADVLAGEVEPGGRLPTSVPAREPDSPVLSTQPVDGVLEYAEGSAVGYRGYAARGAVPAFPFGHGLGYTTWAYGDALARDDGAGGLLVEVAVRNTGEREGREVVQCYLEPIEAPSDLRLVAFVGVEVEAGAERPVRLRIPRQTLATYDEARAAWRPPTGPHRLLIARSALDVRATIDLPADPARSRTST